MFQGTAEIFRLIPRWKSLIMSQPGSVKPGAQYPECYQPTPPEPLFNWFIYEDVE
jgi:hypothetical protein